jgi:hypothetical protein
LRAVEEFREGDFVEHEVYASTDRHNASYG